MSPSPKIARPQAVHGGHIIHALARKYDWFANQMMTEVHIDGGRADLVFVSKAGYLTEFEIKISRADWNADRHKIKWSKPRPSVTRFFYAVPATLATEPPDWLPEHVGLVAIDLGESGIPHAHELRAARRLRSRPVSDAFRQQINSSAYYRFWRAEFARQRLRFYRKPAVADHG